MTVSRIACVQLALVVCCFLFGFDHNNQSKCMDWRESGNRLGIYRKSSLLIFVSQPDSLLLEDKRSKATRIRHIRTVLLFK